MRMANNRDSGSGKENHKPMTGIKSLFNVFRPIREWLNNTGSGGNGAGGGGQPKTSTPISNPILRSSSVNGHHLEQHQTLSATSNANSNNNLYGTIRRPRSDLGQNNMNMPGNNTHIGDNTMLPPVADTTTSIADSTLSTNMIEVEHFSRNAQARMSLPIMQQNTMRRRAYNQLQRRGQQVARSMGIIYLQHKGETKQANLPNELTTIDTIRALFVCAFPHILSMEFMSQPSIKIYIYSPSCNIFYELSDIEEVRHESVLRIHFADPLPYAAAPAPMGLARLPPQPMSQSSLGQPYLGSHQHVSPIAHHQMMNGSGLHHPHPQAHHQPGQIPPPKPRRMVPASYTMHHLNSSAAHNHHNNQQPIAQAYPRHSHDI